MNIFIEMMYCMYVFMGEVIDNIVDMDYFMYDMLDIMVMLRDYFVDFEDFFWFICSYFYWEKYCFDVLFCWLIRLIFDMFDSVD